MTLLRLNLNLGPSPRLSLWLRLRSHRLRIWRMTDYRLLTPLNLRRFRLALVLNLRRLCSSQLLIINHLLSSSFTLGLLLLPHDLSLVFGRRGRRHWLTNTLSLGLLICYAFNSRLLHLLTAQVLHLLARSSITSCCLSRQIGHLFFSRLFRGEIWRRLSLLLRRCCGSFVFQFKFLTPRASFQRLHAHRRGQITFERSCRRRVRNHDWRTV